MCNRFTMGFEEKELELQLGVPFTSYDPGIVLPRYNVAPTQILPGIRRHGNGLEIAAMKWGLVPRWAKPGDRAGTGFFNARWETAGEKPAFREAADLRRCAVPADGYLEWTTVGKAKRPHWFRWHGGRMFFFAALWEPGNPPTVAILTRAATADTDDFHDRMPAILARDQLEGWLDPTKTWADWIDAAPEWPTGTITQSPVNPKINSSKGEDPAWLVPWNESLFG